MPEAVVVGAGPAGLSAAAMLQRAGVDTVVVDRADAVATSWRGHYDRLRLHTVRWLSHLPGLRIPRRYGPWVARDDVVRYLESYVTRHGLEVRLNTAVRRIDREDDRWVLRIDDGGADADIEARYVVIATGHNHTPWMPRWPGIDSFAGEIFHASAYRNARPYTGCSVLVVGAGNTGTEIAADLVEAGIGDVALSIRRPPHIVRRSSHGVPSLALGVLTRRLPTRIVDRIAARIRRAEFGDLGAYGLPTPTDGLYERVLRDDAIPIVDVGIVDLVTSGRVTVVPAVEGFDGEHVLLADGSLRRADVVIAATGYRRGLDPLVGHLGVLDSSGRPVVRGASTAPGAPGLWFTGYTNPISGMFREFGIDARRIARAVVRDRSARRSSQRGQSGAGGPGDSPTRVSPVLDALRASLPAVIPAKEAWRR